MVPPKKDAVWIKSRQNIWRKYGLGREKLVKSTFLNVLSEKMQKSAAKSPKNPQKTQKLSPEISQTPEKKSPVRKCDVSEKSPFEVSDKSNLSEKSPSLCKKSPFTCDKVPTNPQNESDVKIEVEYSKNGRSKFSLKSPKLRLSTSKNPQVKEIPRPIWPQKSPKLKLSLCEKPQVEEIPRPNLSKCSDRQFMNESSIREKGQKTPMCCEYLSKFNSQNSKFL